MVQKCVVPRCNNSTKIQGITFHRFPKDETLTKEWKRKIRRDEKKCVPISFHMRVCSGHFLASDYNVNCLNRKVLNENAIPSVFNFTSPRKIKTPRRIVVRVNQEATAAVDSPRHLVFEEPTAQDILMEEVAAAEEIFAPAETEKMNNSHTTEKVSEENGLNEMVTKLQNQLLDIQRQNVVLTANMDKMEQEALEYQNIIKESRKESEIKYSKYALERDFTMTKVKASLELLTYYTGFDSVEMYEAFHDYVNPGRRISHSLALLEEDQMLLVLAKLRQGFDHFDLAFRFKCSPKHVSKVFSCWINDFYYRLGCLNIWPHRDVIFENSPPIFKEKYPTCIIILDGTEMKIETPSSLVLQSQSYSSYKSSNTVKGLVGCDPKGGITFISQLYTGSISDKKITEESGLYDVLKTKIGNGEVLKEDIVMVDKGFNIRNEIEALGLNLNVPPMASTEQFEEEQVYDTRKIASCRVHVERTIRRVKTFKILHGVIPVSSLPHLNQVWTVCCILAGFRCVTKSEPDVILD